MERTLSTDERFRVRIDEVEGCCTLSERSGGEEITWATFYDGDVQPGANAVKTSPLALLLCDLLNQFGSAEAIRANVTTPNNWPPSWWHRGMGKHAP